MARAIFDEITHWAPEPVSKICAITRTGLSTQAQLHAEEFGIDVLTGSNADAAIDSGYELLIFADEEPPLAALSLIAAFSNVNVTAVMPSLSDDGAWMSFAAQLRDAARCIRPHLAEVDEAFAQVEAAGIPAVHADLLAAAKREVPVLINGIGALAAAVTADRISHAAPRWWMVADRANHPAVDVAMQRIDLPALTSFDISDAYLGAFFTVPIIRSAAAQR